MMLLGPYVIWYMDLPYQAGVTIISEYSVILTMRWIIIVVLQLPLLLSFFNAAVTVVNLLLNSLQKLADFANRSPRAADGTFIPSRLPGRPRKRND